MSRPRTTARTSTAAPARAAGSARTPARRTPGAGATSGRAAPGVFPLRSVAVVIDDDVSPFEMAVACEVFGTDRSDSGVPAVDFAVCSQNEGVLRAGGGLGVVAEHRLDRLRDADLVIVPACGSDCRPSAELVEALQAVVERGGRVASLCSGAFVLARAGLLDGRRATTHWRHTDAFEQEFPQVELVPDVLFVEDGPIATSAGTAAGIDLCLHLVRQAFGAAAANTVARRMVVPPQRDGGQAQFVESPVRDVRARTLAPVLDWAAGHLDEDLSVAILAARAAMSERTFARRFRDETGTTPHAWLLARRVALAEELLETGHLGVEEVARRCGFGSATMLRHHFTRLRGTAPTRYRRTFGHTAC
ncbi:MAG: helix-turn-helix domain-containing protein [Kineosporiaceae bacterium]|jgi:transcriptional regulator GlxA family with amidase domain